MTTSEQLNNSIKQSFNNGDKRDNAGRFTEGNTGGPGRPKGSFSIKDQIRKAFEEDSNKLKKFIDFLLEKQPGLVWQMLEGRPSQQTGITADIRPIPILDLTEIYDITLRK